MNGGGESDRGGEGDGESEGGGDGGGEGGEKKDIVRCYEQ